MKKNLLKSAVLALTLITTFTTSAVSAFASATPETTAVAYSASTSLSRLDIHPTIASLNMQAYIMTGLTPQLEAKLPELEKLAAAGVSDKNIVQVLKTLLDYETHEIVYQFEPALTELTTLKIKLMELREAFAGIEPETVINMAIPLYVSEAEIAEKNAADVLARYTAAVTTLQNGVNEFEANANS